MKRKLYLLATICAFSTSAISQNFINGSFESNGGVQLINPTAPTFNASVTDVNGFHDVAAGVYFNADLMNSVYGTAQDGDWFLGFTPADALAIELDVPLTNGATYTMSCWLSSNPGYTSSAFYVGATEDPTDLGILVNTLPAPVSAVWVNHTFTFVAPNNATHIVVSANGMGGSLWTLADNFEIVCDALTTVVSDTEICLGEEITLDATSVNGGTITWDGGLVNDVPFEPLTPGVHTFTATSSSPDDCPYSIDITVHDAPTVTASADATEVCDGDMVTLTGGGADTYAWDGGVTDGVAFIPPLGTTTYTVTGTDVNGCENTETIDITVNPLPTVVANADDADICVGEEVTLTGSGAVDYVWTDGVTDGVPFTPAATTTYTVTGTDVNGCVNTDDITVTVNPSPTIDGGLDQTVCEGDAATLAGSGAGIGGTYAWTGGVTDGVPFTPGATMTYTVTGTTAEGCEGTDDVTITVVPLPVIDAGLDATICTDEEITLSGSGAGMGGTYVWTGGVTDGVPFTPGVTTTYTVTGTTPEGCVGTDDVTITVGGTATIDAGEDQMVCDGDEVTLSGDGAGIGGTYVWTGGVTDGTPFTPGATMTYTVTGTTAGGCEGMDDVTVTVNPIPVIDAGLDIAICEGEEATLAGSGAGMGGTYSWTGGVSDGTPFEPAATSTYTVTGTDVNGCSNTDDVTVTVNQLPTVVFAGMDLIGCNPVTVDFNTDTPGATYEWNFGDGTLSGLEDPSHTYTTDGSFDVTLTVTSIDGCVGIATYADYITVVPQPIPNFTTVTSNGDGLSTVAEFNNTSLYSDSYIWDFGDGSSTSTEVSPTHVFNGVNESEYQVELTAFNSLGCNNSIIYMVEAKDPLLYFIPNTFTPDGDDFNEEFKPIFVSGFDPYDFHLMIFNRWGEMVFESFNAAYGWNGFYGNEGVVKDGVYVWKIEFADIYTDKKFYEEGHVTILR